MATSCRDDRVELYLKASEDSPYFHYAVNVLGTFADEKIQDRTWNGMATSDVRMAARLLAGPDQDTVFGYRIRFLCEHNLEGFGGGLQWFAGQQFLLVLPSLLRLHSPWRHSRLWFSQKSLPFVEKVGIGAVKYDTRGNVSLPVDCVVKNPTAEIHAVEVGGTKIEVPGSSSRTVAEKILPGRDKISTVNLQTRLRSIPGGFWISPSTCYLMGRSCLSAVRSLSYRETRTPSCCSR